MLRHLVPVIDGFDLLAPDPLAGAPGWVGLEVKI